MCERFFSTLKKIILNLELGADAWRFLLGVQVKQGPGHAIVLGKAHDELQRS